jgi:hypothetical protein
MADVMLIAAMTIIPAKIAERIFIQQRYIRWIKNIRILAQASMKFSCSKNEL